MELTYLELPLQTASLITSVISLTNALTSPIAGTLVGFVGRRTYIAIVSTVLLTVVYLCIMMEWIPPLSIFILVGLCQSLFDSFLFPSVAILVDTHVTGMATGLMMWAYDVLLTVSLNW